MIFLKNVFEINRYPGSCSQTPASDLDGDLAASVGVDDDDVTGCDGVADLERRCDDASCAVTAASCDEWSRCYKTFLLFLVS